MPTATELAIAFKKAIDRQDAAALTRLARTYHTLYLRMQDKLDALLLAISKMNAPTRGQIMRLAQYKNLIGALEVELKQFGGYVAMELQSNSRAAIELALKQTNEYLITMGYAMPKSLPVNAIYNMLGFLQEDSPLFKRIELLAPYHTKKVADSLLEGIALGYNPTKTARMFQNVMGGGLTDAMRMSRTAQLYASREASRAQFIANQDVVDGWTWWSSKDASTCMACLANHGKVFPLTERLNGHYNCRCVAIPHVKIWSEPEQTGEEWFSTLSEAQQKEMMGAQTWNAWKGGAFNFNDLSGHRHDDVYGNMNSRVPLKDLLGNKLSNIPETVESLTARLQDIVQFKNGAPNLSGLEPQTIKDITHSYEKVIEKYPQLKGKFEELSVADLRSNTYAYAPKRGGRGQIYLNRSYYTEPEPIALKYSYSSGVKSGFHPAGTTYKSIITHEIGHTVDDRLSFFLIRDKNASFEMKALLDKQFGLTDTGIKRMVSRYATKNDAELFAELFAEYIDSPSPRPVATRFGEILDEWMKDIK